MSCYALFLFMNVTCTVKYLLAFFVLFFQLFLYKQEILSFKGVQCRMVLVVNFFRIFEINFFGLLLLYLT